MSDFYEVDFDYSTGKSLYFTRFTASGEVLLTSGSASEVWGTGARDADYYDVAMSEVGSSGHYVQKFDSASNVTTPGRNDEAYRVNVYLRSGASAADTDPRLGKGRIDWTGASEDFVPLRRRIR